VFFGAVVLLVPVLRQGPTPRRVRQLCATFAVSVRTLRRWRRWWQETFPASRYWLSARGRLSRPLAADALPRALLDVWAMELGERTLAALRFLMPISASAERAI
jgi:hypothetical protein